MLVILPIGVSPWFQQDNVSLDLMWLAVVWFDVTGGQ
jgi:hypothetical protein